MGEPTGWREMSRHRLVLICGALGLAAVSLVSTAGPASASAPGQAPSLLGPRRAATSSNEVVAYVSDYHANTVLPVAIPNSSTFDYGPELPLEGYPFGNPVGIAAAPDGSMVYVDDSTQALFEAIDPVTGRLVSSATISSPWGMALTPDGSTAVVADRFNGSVTELDVASSPVSVTRVIPLSGAAANASPHFVAVSPDGTTAWVTTGSPDLLVPISVATGAEGTPIALPGTVDLSCGPSGLALTPDGATAIVACGGAAAADVVDLATAAVDTVQFNSFECCGAEQVAVTPDGTRAVVSWNDDINGGQVSILDLSSPPTVAATLQLPGESDPEGIVVTPDGTTALVAGRDVGQLSVVHLDSSPPTVDATTIPVGGAGDSGPFMMALAPPPELSVAIAVKPTTVTYGEKVIVAGLLSEGRSRTPVPGASYLVLLAHRPGATSWQKVAESTTNKDGIVSFAASPAANVDLAVVFRGITTYDAAESRAVEVLVRPRVTAKLSSSSSPVNRSVEYSGVVQPSHAGEIADVQDMTEHGWQTFGHQRLSKSSRFAFSVYSSSRGSFRIRLFVPAGHGDIAGWSSPSTLHVT